MPLFVAYGVHIFCSFQTLCARNRKLQYNNFLPHYWHHRQKTAHHLFNILQRISFVCLFNWINSARAQCTHSLSRSKFQLKIIFDNRSNYSAQFLPFRNASHANFIAMHKYVYAKRNRSNVRKCNSNINISILKLDRDTKQIKPRQSYFNESTVSAAHTSYILVKTHDEFEWSQKAGSIFPLHVHLN